MTPFAGNSAYQGKRILVVESDVLVPFALYRMIERFGAEIVGPVGFADDLTLLARDLQFDGAIIDSRIPADGRRSIEALMRRLDVPFVEACRSMQCISGNHGCYRLVDAEADLAVVADALFSRCPGRRTERRAAGIHLT